jgi:hypothetical protein
MTDRVFAIAGDWAVASDGGTRAKDAALAYLDRDLRAAVSPSEAGYSASESQEAA